MLVRSIKNILLMTSIDYESKETQVSTDGENWQSYQIHTPKKSGILIKVDNEIYINPVQWAHFCKIKIKFSEPNLSILVNLPNDYIFERCVWYNNSMQYLGSCMTQNVGHIYSYSLHSALQNCFFCVIFCQNIYTHRQYIAAARYGINNDGFKRISSTQAVPGQGLFVTNFENWSEILWVDADKPYVTYAKGPLCTFPRKCKTLNVIYESQQVFTVTSKNSSEKTYDITVDSIIHKDFTVHVEEKTAVSTSVAYEGHLYVIPSDLFYQISWQTHDGNFSNDVSPVTVFSYNICKSSGIMNLTKTIYAWPVVELAKSKHIRVYYDPFINHCYYVDFSGLDESERLCSYKLFCSLVGASDQAPLLCERLSRHTAKIVITHTTFKVLVRLQQIFTSGQNKMFFKLFKHF